MDTQPAFIVTREIAEPTSFTREPRAVGPSVTRTTPLCVRLYDADDSVLVNGTYLIRGVAGRILFFILRLHAHEGRTMFLNRELRLHRFLKLPPYKDNLETRLLNLQRRLDERALPFRLRRQRRGRVELTYSGPPLVLEHIPAPGTTPLSK